MPPPLLLDREDQLYALAAAYLEALEAGQVGEAERLLAERAEMADDVRRLLEEQDALAGLAAPFRVLAHLGEAETGNSNATQPAMRSAGVPGSGSFGEYELLELIAQGGMGVVYKARHRKLNRLTALKMVLTGPWSTPADVMRFHTEVQAAELDHPHIVPVYEVGCHEGQHFYVMKLIEGPSLARVIAEQRGGITGRDAARLIVTVARAIQHAHQRGILHRDLKPANVLLASPVADAIRLADMTAFVADFGLAKRVPPQGSAAPAGEPQTLDGAIVGTPSYMAPEQAAGKSQRLSTAADVWGLGAILYEMLTGQPPFRGDSVLDTLLKIQREEPTRPRALDPSIDRDLETICLKCLQKEPTQRYRSAAALADDLERWLERRPILARPVGNAERLWRWCARNPVVSGLVFTMLALLLTMAAAAMSVARERETQLRQEAGRSNLYAARGVASTVLWQLEHLSRPLVRVADDPELQRLLKNDDRAGLTRLCESLHLSAELRPMLPGGETTLQSWYVLNPDGILLGVSPMKRPILSKSFAFRDYFKGAMRHARAGRTGRAAVHLSRVYLAENDGRHKFALSIPVRQGSGANAPLLGVLAVTFTTSSALGALRLDDEKRTVVLAGRGDTADGSSEYLIVLHPVYHLGDRPLALDNHQLRAIHRPADGEEFVLPRGREDEGGIDLDYRDPVGGDYAGRWLAGFAPVGNTECVVIVQQRHESAVEPGASLTRHLLLWGGLALLLGATFSVALRAVAQRRR